MSINISWIVENSNFFQFLTNLALVIVTLIYVIYTKRIVDSTNQQIKFSHSPVLGISINKMVISSRYGHNNLEVTLEIANLGNAPAIEILIDSEIELKYTDYDGEKVIPSSYKPYLTPYLQINEKFTTKLGTSKHFGAKPTYAIISDFKKMHILNMERRVINPLMESYDASTFRIFVYYKNNLNQNFMSYYETILSISPNENTSILFNQDENSVLPSNQLIQISEHPFKSPSFFTKPISDDIPRKEILVRNKKRDRVEY
jgi:hypothetical protein